VRAGRGEGKIAGKQPKANTSSSSKRKLEKISREKEIVPKGGA